VKTSPEVLLKLTLPMSDAEAAVIGSRDWLAKKRNLPEGVRNHLWLQLESNSREFLPSEEWQVLQGCREVEPWTVAISSHFAKRMKNAGMQVDESLELRVEEGRLVIEPTSDGLDDLLARMTPENQHGLVLDGPAAGTEVW
jgi:antitoxin MazE